jgi:hypothetical protein
MEDKKMKEGHGKKRNSPYLCDKANETSKPPSCSEIPDSD